MGARLLQRRHDVDGGRVAHVVGVGLEGEAQQRDGLASDRTAAGLQNLARHGALALRIDGGHGLHDAQGRAHVLPGLDEGQRILGKARTAIARTRMQELRADAIVEADATRHILHIGAGALAQIRDLVDEGDLRRQKGVGGIFGELRRAARREENRRLVEIERAIDLAHHFARPLIFDADDDAVRPFEIIDRRALAQELGIGDHGEVASGRGLADDALHLVARAHGHGGFGDHDREAIEGGRNLLRGLEDIGQVCMAVAAARGRAHRNEDRIRIAHGGA